MGDSKKQKSSSKQGETEISKEQEKLNGIIKDALKEIIRNREQRYGSVALILQNLGYLGDLKTTDIPKLQLDAFLIKVANQVFKDDSLHRDVALMALGLLKGFEWSNYSIGVREENFLSKTSYLNLKSKRTITDFDIADIDEKEHAISALSKVERDQLSKISIYLSTKKVELDKKGPSGSEYFKKYVNNIDYLTKRDNDGKILSIEYPEPTYLKPPKEPEDYIPQIFIELKKINNRTNLIHNILKKFKIPAVQNILILIALSTVLLGGFTKVYALPKLQSLMSAQNVPPEDEEFQDEKDFFSKNDLDEFASASNVNRHSIMVVQSAQAVSSPNYKISQK